MDMVFHVKVQSLTTYHILLAEFGELPIGLYIVKLTMGFQQWLTHLSSSWLVSRASSLSRHLPKQRFNTCYKSTTMWRTSWALSYQDTHGNPIASKVAYSESRRFFLLKSGTLSISKGRNQITSTSRNTLNKNVYRT